jgi:hypothetical protein
MLRNLWLVLVKEFHFKLLSSWILVYSVFSIFFFVDFVQSSFIDLRPHWFWNRSTNREDTWLGEECKCKTEDRKMQEFC